MKRTISIVAVIVLLCASGMGMGVSAQSGGNTTNTDQTDTEPPALEDNTIVREITSNVVVRNITFDFENEVVEIRFDSNVEESVTVTSAIITEDTETLNRETYTVNGTTVVRFDTPNVNNQMAITIDGDELHVFFEDKQRFSFTGTYESQQVILAIVFGGLLGVSTVSVAAYKRQMKIKDEVERVTP